MAERLLNQYREALSEVALKPSTGGAFEVTIGDERVYSKLETGTFPSERAVVSQIGAKL